MILIAVIFLLLITFMFTQVRLVIFYKRDSGHDHMKVELGLLNGWIPIRKEIPYADFHFLRGLKIKHSTKSGKKTLNTEDSTLTLREVKYYQLQMRKLLKQIYGYSRIMKRFLHKIKVIKLKWKSTIGTGDAAETGLLSGLFWGLKGTAVMAFQHFMRLKTRPHIWVEPSFARKQFATEFECILQFRLGYVILTGFYLLINWRKGRDRAWHNTQLKA